MDILQLKNGQVGILKSIDSVDEVLKIRLRSIGMMPGCKICLKQTSYFNGPCVLEFQGQQISIRKSEAKMIEVQTI